MNTTFGLEGGRGHNGIYPFVYNKGWGHIDYYIASHLNVDPPYLYLSLKQILKIIHRWFIRNFKEKKNAFNFINFDRSKALSKFLH